MTNSSCLSLVWISALLVGMPLYGQSVCTAPWTLEETLRIGSLDGDDALSSVMDLEVGPDGEIYVAQLFVPQVTVFTADGRLSHTIGRAGTGPGEFDGWAVRLGWIQDTLWVTDHSAMNFFSPDGSEVRQVFFSTRLSNEGSRFQPGTPLQDGSFLGRRGLRGNIAAFLVADRLSIPRFSASGEIFDTIAWGKQRLIVQVGSGAFVHHPLDDLIGYAAVPLAATHDGSAIILLGEVRDRGRSPSFDLLKLSITGDTLYRRSIPYEPKPVTRAQRRWLSEVFGNNMAGDYYSGPNGLLRDDATKERQRRDWRQAITFPEHHPPVRRIVTGKDGSIWILRELTTPDLVDRWEVYDGDGELQGVVLISDGKASPIPWQPRLNILRVTRDEVWGTTINTSRCHTSIGIG